MVPSKMPKRPAMMPLSIVPLLSAATIRTPKRAIAAISENEKASMNGRKKGMLISSASAPIKPPMAETAYKAPKV
jgi:hypothetical protein